MVSPVGVTCEEELANDYLILKYPLIEWLWKLSSECKTYEQSATHQMRLSKKEHLNIHDAMVHIDFPLSMEGTIIEKTWQATLTLGRARFR